MTTIKDYLRDAITEWEDRSSKLQSENPGRDVTQEELDEIKTEVVEEYGDYIKERIVG